jgi:hypothetical protein
MVGIVAPSIPTYVNDPNAVTVRDAEYLGTPFIDVNGTANYIGPYLGMNRAGSNAPGIGIATGIVSATAAAIAAFPDDQTPPGPYPEKFTLLDQDTDARIPQVSTVIGNDANTVRVGNVATTWDKSQALYTDSGAASSGGLEGKATDPVRFIYSVPNADPNVSGTVDVNDTANLVITDAAAVDGAEMDTVTGALNDTGETVAIGDMVWGRVPVA